MKKMAPLVHNNKHTKMKRFKKEKNKLNLVFDENARRDFLTGFQKRKHQRKEKAKKELGEQLKKEKKRIQVEAKETYKRLVASQKPVPEVEHLWAQEVDMDTHSVFVKELSAASLSRQNNYIGLNQVKYEGSEDESTEDAEVEKDEDEVEGMELKKQVEGEVKERKVAEKENLKSKKDVKNYVRKQATQLVHSSKVFEKEKKVRKLKDIKARKRQERNTAKRKKRKDKRTRHKR